MRLYKNGDRCPCCGTVLKGKSEDWLLLFSQTVDLMELPPWEASPLSDPPPRISRKPGGSAANHETETER